MSAAAETVQPRSTRKQVTVHLEHGLCREVEKLSREEKRSFSRQLEVLVGEAIEARGDFDGDQE